MKLLQLLSERADGAAAVKITLTKQLNAYVTANSKKPSFGELSDRDIIATFLQVDTKAAKAEDQLVDIVGEANAAEFCLLALTKLKPKSK